MLIIAPMRRLVVLLIVLASSQSQAQQQNFNAKILDASSKKGLAYAAIYNQSIQKGSISDELGNFEMSYRSLNDTLVFQYLGYEKRALTVESILGSGDISLQAKSQTLSEHIVVAENEWLFKILAKCKFSNEVKPSKSKAYFSLESYINSEQHELIEAFYNAEFKGASLESLKLKNGRIGSKYSPLIFGHYISFESSKAIQNYRPFESNTWFPKSALAMNKRQMKKQYNCRLISKTNLSDQEVLYKIEASPKDKNASLFSLVALVDSASNALRWVQLGLESPTEHPFVPFGEDSIELLSLNIEIELKLEKGRSRIKSQNFDYQLRYWPKRKGLRNKSVDITSNAVLFTYGE